MQEIELTEKELVADFEKYLQLAESNIIKITDIGLVLLPEDEYQRLLNIYRLAQKDSSETNQ